MVTKWKKWSINVLLVYVLGISLLAAGGLGIFGSFFSEGGMKAALKPLADRDFQNTDAFRSYIAYHLEDFLSMACGDYVSGYGYYNYDTEVYSGDVVKEQWETDTEYVMEMGIAEEDVSYWNRQWTKQEKKASAEAYDKALREDKNLLYRISYDGELLYTNMDEIEWDWDAGSIPGYNFYLLFDGSQAVIKKDGKELNIYGDGIYREDDDWQIPGFQNYPVNDNWKNAEVVMLAAEEPALYTEGLYHDNVSWSANELYYLYKDYQQVRKTLCRNILYLAAGLLLLAWYQIRKKEKGEAGKKMAGFTKRIWFEWKTLLFFVLPLLLCAIAFRSGNGDMPAYVSEMLNEDMPMGAYVSEASGILFQNLADLIFWLLPAWWLLYLFYCDLRYNTKSYQNGCMAKLAAVFRNRDLKLPAAKRMIKRSYGVFVLTLAQFGFFFILLIVSFVSGYKESWDNYYEIQNRTSGILAASLALTVGLLITEYIYQKKNRQMAEDMERLAGRISDIKGGNYGRRTDVLFEDADIRKMEEELEEIREGLASAVEEQISSERMKVELVTNVSHDIKTPLTSIISYIQLLKQEENLPGHILDYIHILDEKSERLKNMVGDVFAVSKAASGQLEVEIKELDLGKLLYQTLADMEEIIEKSPVRIKTEIPKDPTVIQADGQRMYRVFQNLIGNALKYSLEGSRIYITLQQTEGIAAVSVKNTSSQELNSDINFAERFTRGDKSRTDGGSGLGLSIAKSFTEACGGSFELETIADLFAVTVKFPVCRQSMAES